MGLILGQSTLSRQYQAIVLDFIVANMMDVASGQMWWSQLKSIRVPVNAVRILTIGHLDKLHSHLTLQFNGHFSKQTWASRYQNVSNLDFVGAKDDGGGGGDNWSYKTCTAPIKSSPTTHQHWTFYRPNVLSVTQPTVSKQWITQGLGNGTFLTRPSCQHPELPFKSYTHTHASF